MLQGFMGIRSFAKQMQSSFNKSSRFHELLVWMQIPRVIYHAVFFYVFQECS